MMNSHYFFAVVFFFSHLSAVRGILCYNCATTELRELWASTGLASLPSTLQFLDGCFTNSESDWSNQDSTECSSTCMELLIPYEKNNIKKYGAVRGCYSDFFPNAVTQRTVGWSRPADGCQYGDGDTPGTYINVTKSTTVLLKEYKALRFCSNSTSTVPCNGAFTYYREPSSFDAIFTNNNCVKATNKLTCLKCNGLIEKCDKAVTSTCNGEFCKKYEGTSYGQKVEIRGCSPINPMGESRCDQYSSNYSIPVPMSLYRRKRRSTLHKGYDYGTGCFCNTNYCNGALSVTFSIASLAILCFTSL